MTASSRPPDWSSASPRQRRRSPIITAGIAGLAAGAVAMALGEYVSVSSQRDTERALLAKERAELTEQPHRELAELAGIYQAQGLTPRPLSRSRGSSPRMTRTPRMSTPSWASTRPS